MLHQPSYTFDVASAARPADDKVLIALCRRAARQLEVDRIATDRLCDIQAVMEAWEANHRPTYPSSFPDRPPVPESGPRALKRDLAKLPKDAPAVDVDALKARLAAAEAFEVAYKAKDDEIGFTRASRTSSRFCGRTRMVVGEVIATPAQTVLGLAAKAAVLQGWQKAGYTIDDEGEDLALSIAEDARMLGTGGAVRASTARPPRSDATAPAHH